jgi:L-ascorbate metabolism protein UlaG (beta-lactamase superfamily)
VFISHDHHDHFDKAAIEWLARNHRPKFFIGRESQDLFPKSAEVVQLDWNQPAISTIAGKPYRIHFFPVGLCEQFLTPINDCGEAL